MTFVGTTGRKDGIWWPRPRESAVIRELSNVEQSNDRLRNVGLNDLFCFPISFPYTFYRNIFDCNANGVPLQPLRDIAVVSGKTARFECIAQGEPVDEVTWSCDGHVLENSDCYQTQYRNGVCRLTIPKAYKCEYPRPSPLPPPVTISSQIHRGTNKNLIVSSFVIIVGIVVGFQLTPGRTRAPFPIAWAPAARRPTYRCQVSLARSFNAKHEIRLFGLVLLSLRNK